MGKWHLQELTYIYGTVALTRVNIYLWDSGISKQ